MIVKRILLYLSLYLMVFSNLQAEKILTCTQDKDVYDLTDYIRIINDEQDTFRLSHTIKIFQDESNPLLHKPINYDSKNHWVYLKVFNQSHYAKVFKFSVAFSDHTYSYHIQQDNKIILSETGDALGLSNREVKVGQVCFSNLEIPAGQYVRCYIKVKSISRLSRQFKKFSLQSFKIYSPKGFEERFEKPRIYQAFFYGALTIMLLFNLFIFVTTSDKNYLSYVIFLFFLGVFLASNNGYLYEIIFPELPTLDLYIRFLSPSFLVISYLVFSQYYLGTLTNAPVLNRWIKIMIAVYVGIIIVMSSGSWYIGRSAVILISVTSFTLIFIASFRIWRQGFSPAKYFLAGNLLLLIGGVMYAVQRFFVVVHSPATQYSIQIATLLEIALFSMGLAARINLTQKELALTKIEKEIKEKEAEIERKKIIEEKNIQLQKSNQELDAFIYKTAHDIRGPLARLMGLCKIGLMDVTDSTGLDYLTKLNDNANNLNFILNRLSLVYDISSLKIDVEELDAQKSVDAVLKDISFYESFDATQFQIDIGTDKILADNKLTYFILLNLIENAVKFCKPESDVQHQVFVQLKQADGLLTILVKDNGIGIPKDEEDTIFDIFSKAADKFQSPGLGLYMVRLGLEKVKGSIEYELQGNLTVFEVKIPFDATTYQL